MELIKRIAYTLLKIEPQALLFTKRQVILLDKTFAKI